MRKHIYITFVIIIGIIISFSACIEPVEYPIIPEISYKDFSMTSSIDILDNEVQRAVLTMHITDGDGDIGLNDSDTTGHFDADSIYYNDLFLILYEKIDGQFVEKELIVPHNYRVPYIQPQGQVRSISADIQVTLDYTNGTFVSDTIMYEFYLYDRSLNKSNIAESPELAISYYLSLH